MSVCNHHCLTVCVPHPRTSPMHLDSWSWEPTTMHWNGWLRGRKRKLHTGSCSNSHMALWTNVTHSKSLAVSRSSSHTNKSNTFIFSKLFGGYHYNALPVSRISPHPSTLKKGLCYVHLHITWHLHIICIWTKHRLCACDVCCAAKFYSTPLSGKLGHPVFDRWSDAASFAYSTFRYNHPLGRGGTKHVSFALSEEWWT